MSVFIPADEAVAALAETLCRGPWRFGVHTTLPDGGLYRRQSVADKRVAFQTFVPKRGEPASCYVFADPGVDMPVRAGGPIVAATDAREFATLEAVAAAILIHDRALAEEREWLAPAPALSEEAAAL